MSSPILLYPPLKPATLSSNHECSRHKIVCVIPSREGLNGSLAVDTSDCPRTSVVRLLGLRRNILIRLARWLRDRCDFCFLSSVALLCKRDHRHFAKQAELVA